MNDSHLSWADINRSRNNNARLDEDNMMDIEHFDEPITNLNSNVCNSVQTNFGDCSNRLDNSARNNLYLFDIQASTANKSAIVLFCKSMDKKTITIPIVNVYRTLYVECKTGTFNECYNEIKNHLFTGNSVRIASAFIELENYREGKKFNYIVVKYPFSISLRIDNKYLARVEHIGKVYGVDIDIVKSFVVHYKCKGCYFINVPEHARILEKNDDIKHTNCTNEYKEISCVDNSSLVENIVKVANDKTSWITIQSLFSVVAIRIVTTRIGNVQQIVAIKCINRNKIDQKLFLLKIPGVFCDDPYIEETNDVCMFDTERNLITEFITYIYSCDPDVLVGHKLYTNDLSIIIERCRACQMNLNLFWKFSRLKGVCSNYTPLNMIKGRLMCDTYD